MPSRMGSWTKGALRASECQHVTSVFRKKLAAVRKVDCDKWLTRGCLPPPLILVSISPGSSVALKAFLHSLLLSKTAISNLLSLLRPLSPSSPQEPDRENRHHHTGTPSTSAFEPTNASTSAAILLLRPCPSQHPRDIYLRDPFSSCIFNLFLENFIAFSM